MWLRKSNNIRLKELKSDKLRVSKCYKKDCTNYDKYSETNCILSFNDAVKCIHGEESLYED